MAVVRLLAQDGSGRVLQSYTVVGDDAILGRAEGVAIHIEDPSVSRQHARIFRGPNGFEIIELSPTNGVLIGGQRAARHVLRSGERFRLGNLDFVFEHDDPRQAGTVMVGQSGATASVAAHAPTPTPAPAHVPAPAPASVTPTPEAARAKAEAAGPRPAGGRRWGMALFLLLAGTAGAAVWLFASGWVGDYFSLL